VTKTDTRPLTLRDVSEASGVSEMTVSRVLRNRGDVSAATREKVLQATRELGYVPNKIAGALASQRVNLVAVIIPSMSNMVFPEVMTGISQILEDTDLQPVVGVTDYQPEKEERVLLIPAWVSRTGARAVKWPRRSSKRAMSGSVSWAPRCLWITVRGSGLKVSPKRLQKAVSRFWNVSSMRAGLRWPKGVR